MTAQKGEREEALSECPFCKSGRENVAALMREGGTWRVWCLRPASVCGYIGPDKTTEAEAIAHHNLSSSKAEGEMREALDRDIGALLRIYENASVDDDVDFARVQEIATAFGERCMAEAIEAALSPKEAGK